MISNHISEKPMITSPVNTQATTSYVATDNFTWNSLTFSWHLPPFRVSLTANQIPLQFPDLKKKKKKNSLTNDNHDIQYQLESVK